MIDWGILSVRVILFINELTISCTCLYYIYNVKKYHMSNMNIINCLVVIVLTQLLDYQKVSERTLLCQMKCFLFVCE